MIPVTQDIFGITGNCMAACVASIFELPLRDVPHFAEHNATENASDWFGMFWKFVSQRGYDVVPYYISGLLDGKERPLLDFNDLPPHLKKLILHPYYLQCGPAARGFSHATVGWNGQTIHDPHPSRAGLIRTDSYYLFAKRTPQDT